MPMVVYITCNTVSMQMTVHSRNSSGVITGNNAGHLSILAYTWVRSLLCMPKHNTWNEAHVETLMSFHGMQALDMSHSLPVD